jgi:PilZ domain
VGDGEVTSIPLKRHRAQRFPFVAGIQITALDTQAHLAAHTEDLNLSGCFVETTNPFIGGTKVGLRISHDGVIFVAQGTVAYSLGGKGMGIKFTFIEPSSVAILDGWLTAQNVTE